jgi:glycosyltransferase involved in cell wall biosynthesis/O-antigen/teichoic acid export membrane protein
VTSAESETPSSAATPVATGLRDGVALGATKLLQAVLAVLTLKALLRVTDETGYGIYSTFLLVANVAIALTGWPAGSVLRLGAEEWVETRRLARTYALHVLLALAAGLVLAVPLLLSSSMPGGVADLVDRYVTVKGAAWIVVGYAVVTALANVSAALLKPAARVAQFALLPLVTRFFYLGVLAWFAHEHEHLEARSVMLICLATAVPQLAAGLLLVVPVALPPALPRATEAKAAVRFGVPFLFRQLGMQSFAYVNLATIKHVQGLVAAGRFNVAGTLAEQTALLAVAIEDLMGPILARSAAEGNQAVLKTYYRRVAPQVALVWSTACGAVLILATPILTALSARHVESSGPALQVLLVATSVRVLISLEAPVFDSHLISGPPLAFYALGFATNLALDLLWVPRYGIEGAAWASVCGWTVNAVLRGGYLGVRFRVPSPSLVFYVAPAGIALLYARLLGGSLGRDLGAAVAFLALALLGGKLAGVFSRAGFDALEGVRMPASVRRLLAWFYGAGAKKPVVFAIPKAEMGGAQRSLALLLRSLDREEFPPRVLLGEDGPLARELERLSVPFEVANASFRSLPGLLHFLRFARGAHVLHLYGARTLALAARLQGIRVIERVNLLRGPEAGGYVESPALDRLLLRLDSLLVVPAKAMAEQLEARGVPAAKIRLVPNGVFLPAPSAPRDALRAKLGVARDAFFVLGVGRLAPVKGFDVLAQAFATLKEELPGARLLIAGEGPERARLEEKLPAVLLGDREDIADLLEAADAFVQPSRSEVLSNALLEAMLAGKACVATDVGGTRELVTAEETGLLVPGEDPRALASALLRLAKDEALRARLGAKARESVAATRSLEAMARGHEAVWREALA